MCSSTGTCNKPLHVSMPVNSFGLSALFCSFHDGLLAAAEQAATCDGAYATERDHCGCNVAGRGHIDHFCILAIILSLCGSPATEQANKSGGALAATQSIHVSGERSDIVVKDEHHCCRAFLLASCAIVRSDSNGKQGWQP